jgi:hypothetical protein
MTSSAERPRLEHASRTTIPDFFIVGHPKCGTTALYEMLRQHPQIHMPVKEPWFFVPERARSSPDGGASRSPQELEEYLALFEGAEPGQRIGEATPSYLRSRTAAREIAELAPGARIVAILREPASFLRSFHLQSVQAHVESETDFAKALALEEPRRRGESIPPGVSRPDDLLYSEHVRYVEQLRRYRDAFGAERVLVLIYDDFRDDNEATVREVLRFLEVDDSRPLALVEANPSVRLRSRRMDELVNSLSHGRGGASRALKTAVKTLTPRGLRRGTLASIQRRVVYGEPPPADPALTLELRRRFAGEVRALSEYLDCDLVALWGYDELA